MSIFPLTTTLVSREDFPTYNILQSEQKTPKFSPTGLAPPNEISAPLARSQCGGTMLAYVLSIGTQIVFEPVLALSGVV